MIRPDKLSLATLSQQIQQLAIPNTEMENIHLGYNLMENWRYIIDIQGGSKKVSSYQMIT